MRYLALVLSIAFLFAGISMCSGGRSTLGFVPPGPQQRLRAIGDLKGLPEGLRRAFDPGSDFQPIPRPGPGDWLAVHPERGQTYEAYMRSRPFRPAGRRKKLYFQPLGDFPEGKSPSMSLLQQFASAFFLGLEVKLLGPLPVEKLGITTRVNTYTRRRQLLTGDVLKLLKRKLPADGYCVIAITMEDLYPDPSWNFVFGQASLRERVGVFSFARYDPAFYGNKRGKDYAVLILKRSCKVMSHETCHMFGMTHCIYYRCQMNGSNHLDESDSRPLHLCPVCLRKLHYNLGFDIVKRYRALKKFCENAGIRDEAAWYSARISRIIAGEGPAQDGRR